MSAIRDYIDSRINDGVEWMKLEDICSVITDGSHFSPSAVDGEGYYMPSVKDMTNNGFDFSSCKRISEGDYKELVRNGCRPEVNDVLIAKDGSMLKYVFAVEKESDIVILSSIAILRPKTDFVYPKYLAHYFRQEKFRDRIIREYSSKGGVPRIVLKNFKRIELPIPPIEVQRRIVEILDVFSELSVVLSAELSARKKQYEYYKGLEFQKLSSAPVKHITDVASVKARVGWQRLTTKEFLSKGDYYLITGTDFTSDGKVNYDTCCFVSKERYEMDPNIQIHKDDLLITKDGTLGKVAFIEEEPSKPTTLNSGVFNIRIIDKSISPRYLYHYFTSKVFTDFIALVKTGSTIPHLTQEKLVTLDIPIPSLEEQLRIVRVLDTFESLSDSLSLGIPAELKARKQQYEFYRDQLLTFKRCI